MSPKSYSCSLYKAGLHIELSPQSGYLDIATADCRRKWCFHSRGLYHSILAKLDSLSLKRLPR